MCCKNTLNITSALLTVCCFDTLVASTHAEQSSLGLAPAGICISNVYIYANHLMTMVCESAHSASISPDRSDSQKKLKLQCVLLVYEVF